jgi:uncharacterized membrane protein
MNAIIKAKILSFNTMKPLRPIFIVALIISSHIINAQNLILTKGNRTKEIEIGKFISIMTSNAEGIIDKWNFTVARGKLVSIGKDSITLNLFTKAERISEGKNLREGQMTHYKVDSTQFENSYSKSTIKNLAVWGSREEAIKNRKIWVGIGSTVYALGVFMPWFAVTVENEDTQDRLNTAAIIMILAGATVTVIATPKIFITSNDLRKNKKKKYWKIQ